MELETKKTVPAYQYSQCSTDLYTKLTFACFTVYLPLSCAFYHLVLTNILWRYVISFCNDSNYASGSLRNLSKVTVLMSRDWTSIWVSTFTSEQLLGQRRSREKLQECFRKGNHNSASFIQSGQRGLVRQMKRMRRHLHLKHRWDTGSSQNWLKHVSNLFFLILSRTDKL